MRNFRGPPVFLEQRTAFLEGQMIRFLLLLLATLIPAVSGAQVDWWEPYQSIPPYRIIGMNGESFPPVHGTLLPDGRILLMGRVAEKTVAGTFVPPPVFPSTGFPTAVEPSPINLSIYPVPMELNEYHTPDGIWSAD